MGAGIFLTRHPGILERTFRVSTGYMPREGAAQDPYAHSMQWSRRFIGLKLFLSLAVAGWEGYEAAVRHMAAMGDRLRDGLREAGGLIVNDTPLPVVCFVDGGRDGRSPGFLESVAADVVGSGDAWISTVSLGRRGWDGPARLRHQPPDRAGGRGRPDRGARPRPRAGMLIFRSQCAGREAVTVPFSPALM